MWKKAKRLLLCFVLLLGSTGCWDQDYLKDARLVYGVSFDLAPDGRNIRETVVIREMQGGEAQAQPIDELYTAVGNTVRELRDVLDRQVSGELKPFKNRIILIGDALARQDIYPPLDVVYRYPKSALNAHIAISEGSGADLLKMRKVETTLIAEYLDKIVTSEEDKSTIPKMNLESVLKLLMDPGQDMVLPYFRKIGNKAEIAGVALFHHRRMTGVLHADESLMLSALRREPGQTLRFTEKVHDGKNEVENYVTIDAGKLIRTFKVTADPNGRVSVDLKLRMMANIQEYPKDNLQDEKRMKELGNVLSKQLTEKARNVIQKLQAARCDVFGVGRELMAFHPEVWKKKNWEQDYAKVQFHSQVNVEVVGHGIIN
jgi:Ger(x)C family germination protein